MNDNERLNAEWADVIEAGNTPSEAPDLKAIAQKAYDELLELFDETKVKAKRKPIRYAYPKEYYDYWLKQ
jgi:hypothetical protein